MKPGSSIPKNVTFALYLNVKTRAPTTSCGKNSFSQKAFVSGCVKDSIGSPLSPCTATRRKNDAKFSSYLDEDDRIATGSTQLSNPPRFPLEYVESSIPCRHAYLRQIAVVNVFVLVVVTYVTRQVISRSY